MSLRVTANQVTFGRLVAMPLLAAAFYGGAAWRTLSLPLMLLIGATDFVDGYLARKQGPTVLGGLMDPIADKVYLVVCAMPFADLGLVPWWAVIAILVRELLVTAVRSSFELRQKTLKTTYLAKVKTWVQMIVLGWLLFLALHPTRWVALFPFYAGGGVCILLGIGHYLITKRPWRGIRIMIGCVGAGAVVYLAAGEEVYRQVIIWGMVAITWASGLDYVLVGLRTFTVGRDLHAFDLVRIVGAVAIPVLASLCLMRLPVTPWGPVALVAIELGHGGLDNLLAYHGAAAPAWAWGVRVLGASLLLALALLLGRFGDFFILAALTISVAGTAAAFWRNRKYYLEEKLREKKRTASATPVAG